ncbi:CPBP family intramembrane glutamic endopeptidase [Streptococcus rifensis]
MFLGMAIIVSPLYEELLCRVGLMSLVFKDSRYYLDVLLSSTVFSLMHIVRYQWNTMDFVIYFILGFVCSMIYRTSKSAYYPILAHALANTYRSWAIITYLFLR